MKKSLLYNSFFNILYKLINAIYPLVTSAYVARILAPSIIGEIMFSQTILTYFTTVASLGIPTYGIKVIASVHDNHEITNKRFTELFMINLGSSIICLLVYFIFITCFNEISDFKVMLCFSVILLLNIFNVDWLYQGLEDYKYIAVRNLIVKIVTLILLFLFVKNNGDYLLYTMILIVGICGNYIFNAINLRKYVRFDFKNINFTKHFKPVFILLFVALTTEVYILLDSTMIGIWCNKSDIAFYSNGTKIIRTIFAFLSAAIAVNLPRLSYNNNNDYQSYNKLANQGIKLLLFLSVPASIAVFLLAKPLVLVLFGNAFQNTIIVVRILSLLIFVFSIAYSMGHIVLISVNKEDWILKATITGAIVNFCLNIVLINAIGYIGAVIASLVAEIIVTLVLLRKSLNSIKILIETRYIVSIILSCIAMSCTIIVCLYLIKNMIYQLIISTIVGFFVYIVINIIQKNEYAIYIFKIIFNYIHKVND